MQFVFIGRPQDVLYALGYLRPGILAILLTAGCLIFLWKTVPVRRNFITRSQKGFRNLLILSLLLVPISRIPAKSFFYLITEFWLVVLYFVAFTHFIGRIKDLKKSAVLMIFSSLMLSLALFGKRGGGGRLSTGTMYDPNDVALLFVSILPLALYFSKYSKGLVRILSITTIPFSLLAIGLTQSRGAFVGLCVLFLIWFLQKGKSGASRISIAKILIVIVVIVSLTVLVPDEFWARMQSMGDEKNTGSGRVTIWQRALKMMVWYPQGIGPGCFTSVYGRLLGAGRFEETEDTVRNVAWATAHNSYLLVGVELGIIGLLLYLHWLIGMLYSLHRLRKAANACDGEDAEERAWLCSMVSLGLISFAVPAFFLSQSFSFILLTFCGYVVALERECAFLQHNRTEPGRRNRRMAAIKPSNEREGTRLRRVVGRRHGGLSSG